MTAFARRVASVPVRLPDETWLRICELVCAPDDPALTELSSVTGVAALLISEEYTADDPIIFSGAGAQLRTYTLHGDAALEADLDDETPLGLTLTDSDWAVSLPAREPDIGWASAELRRKSGRVTVRDLAA
jgi:hypothetical protein